MVGTFNGDDLSNTVILTVSMIFFYGPFKFIWKGGIPSEVRFLVWFDV